MKIYNKEDLRKEKIFFNEIFEDSTRFCKKINQIEYLNEGEIPIIDQGKNEIAGYSNLKENVYNDIPAIIFGDHTRNIKYIDFQLKLPFHFPYKELFLQIKYLHL